MWAIVKVRCERRYEKAIELRRKHSFAWTRHLHFLNGDPIEAAIIKGIQIGYRHVDTASVYGSEEAVGKAIKKAIENQIVEREDIFVTTKLWCNEHHDPFSALNSSLK